MGEDLPPSSATRLASMATTMHCAPKRSAASFTNSGRATAAEFDRDLVGPGQQERADILDRAHPAPTVSGMKQASAVRVTTSSSVPRPSWLAVMSRKQSSSAPAAS